MFITITKKMNSPKTKKKKKKKKSGVEKVIFKISQWW